MSQLHQRHIIKKKIINVRTNLVGRSHDISLKVAELAQYEVAAWLDQAYPVMFDDNQLVKLDKLILDVEGSAAHSFASEFPLRLRKALEEAVERSMIKQEVAKNKGETIVEIEETRLELFLYFLKTGRLPRWVIKCPDFKEIKGEVLRQYPEPLKKFITDSADDPIILTRVRSLFSDAELLSIVFAKSQEPAGILMSSLLSESEKLESAQSPREMIWREGLQYIRESGTPDPVRLFWQVINRLAHELPQSADTIIRDTIKALKKSTRPAVKTLVECIAQDEATIFIGNKKAAKGEPKIKQVDRKYSEGKPTDKQNGTTTSQDIQQTNQEAQGKKDSENLIPSNDDLAMETYEKNKKSYSISYQGEEITIWNAGLVLLWPFLEGFFDGLGLIQESTYIDKTAGYKGVYCLQYLADPANQAMEFEFPLNKILCGIDMDEAVSPVALTLNDKTYADGLIKAMISNWPAVGNTSIDSIRQTYFQREGTLSKKDNGWQLVIKKQTWDILLNEMPWGIGMIRLPWNKDLIHVEWN